MEIELAESYRHNLKIRVPYNYKPTCIIMYIQIYNNLGHSCLITNVNNTSTNMNISYTHPWLSKKRTIDPHVHVSLHSIPVWLPDKQERSADLTERKRNSDGIPYQIRKIRTECKRSAEFRRRSGGIPRISKQKIALFL